MNAIPLGAAVITPDGNSGGGTRQEWGTKAAMDHMREMFAWMNGTLVGIIDARSLQLDVTEYDWSKVNNVIYDHNGVVIKSIPAVHLEQSASFILEWNGMTLAYSGDTLPLVMKAVEQYYDGPVDYAQDSMVWNVTKDGVRTRMGVPNPEAYPTPPLQEKKVAAGDDRYQTPASVLDGFPKDMSELAEQIYEDFNKKHGTDFKFQLKK